MSTPTVGNGSNISRQEKGTQELHHERHQTRSRSHFYPLPGRHPRSGHHHATTATAPTSATINQRKENQQDRIAQGVKSGQLTAGETAKLEHQEAGINKEEKGMRAQDNGHLTKADKSLINKQQNQESKRIYRDKHNAKKTGA